MRFIWFSYSLKCLLVTVLLAGNWGGQLAASEARSYDDARGWLERIDVLDASLVRLDRTDYTRSASGRVSRQSTDRPEGKFDYLYDYTGRLLSATNWGGAVGYDQTFTYDTAGSMRSNSALGTYDYGAVNAAHPHAPTAVGLDQITYDLNGNMTVGLGGKVMTYDAENRPLSVSHNGTTTSYVYGPDGTRLKKTEGSDTTVYFGPVEIRKFGQGAAEEIILYLYPHPNVRIVNGVASYLHTDQLGSVRVITSATGASAKETTYRPFGETIDFITDPTASLETKGFIGERYDTDAGLQYLNARYYDPALAMFIQPDWFEVTAAGVGTNRYAYSFNDPVNKMDPGGNFFLGALAGAGVSLGLEILGGIVSGDMPSVRELAKSLAVGAIAGATGVGVVSLVAKANRLALVVGKTGAVVVGGFGGAVAGATGSVLDQAVELDPEGGISIGDVDLNQVAKGALAGQLTGGIAGGVGAGSAIASALGRGAKRAVEILEEAAETLFGEGLGKGVDSILDKFDDDENTEEEDPNVGS